MKFTEIKQLNIPAMEESILESWQEHSIFKKSIEQHASGKTFSFYEGPPTANGRPGIHHVMARTVKDVFCRFKTMQGYRVERKAGWDTHGLPVEIEVEKELGLEGRHMVESYGIEKYNAACRESVLRYKDLWDTLTRRMGYWVDLEDPYVTFKTPYIESVWWLLRQMYEKDLLYKGFKIQWYSPGSGTVLSSHEVSLGYKEVQDPSIYTRFRSREEPDLYYLAWTTTPWTTLSNAGLAVGENIDYVRIHLVSEDIGAHDLILAEARLSIISESYEVVGRLTGNDLLNARYEPLFTYFEGADGTERAWRIVPADYVSTEDGTGIVHTAPAFGADDHATGVAHDLPMLNAIKPDGTFLDDVPLVGGVWFKDADRILSRDLRERGLMYRYETCLHNYPHDWRKGTPLMSYPVDSWFIRTTAIKDRLVSLNREINWQPKGIGTGRFGDWLENNVDWALSRRRYWGTPLPIWQSDAPESEYFEVIGSVAELRAKCGDQLPERDEDVDLHRPFVDGLTWPAPDGGIMRRVEDLIDVWFDSGAMPFAQWHYPFENKDIFERTFPGDFIAEGVDQTRGWFYTLHAIAACVMDSVAYRNVVVNGLVLDEKGEKMSKSKGNAVDPFEVIRKHGIDPVRWYMMSNTPPWENLKFAERGIEETQRKFFSTITNVYSFFATYANIDAFEYGVRVPVHDRPEMDRWILSRYATTCHDAEASLADYNPTRAARAVERLVDELSNWYIRLNRRRFWSERGGAEHKVAAYQTVVEVLLGISRLMAPIAPFYADWLYRQVNDGSALYGAESVHLTSYPGSAETLALRDETLEHRMHVARTISSLVLGLRNQEGINVRQPLPVIMVVTDSNLDERVVASVADIIMAEVNVKTISYVHGGSDLVKRSARPVFKVLGRRLGPLMKPVTSQVQAFGDREIDRLLGDGYIDLDLDGQSVRLEKDEIELQSEGIEGWVVGSEDGMTVALDTTVTRELLLEGLARESVNRIQNMRKEAGMDVTDRIRIAFDGSSDMVEALNVHASVIRNETLGLELIQIQNPDGELVADFDIGSESIRIAVSRSQV